MDTSLPTISVASPGQRAAALELLLTHLPPRECGERTTRLLAETPAEEFLGLLTAERKSKVAGAAWARLQTGRVAHVWAPRLSSVEPESTAAALFDGLNAFLSAGDVRLAQALEPADAGRLAEQFEAAGFRHAADLLYLVSLRGSFPDAAPASALDFAPYRAAEAVRLANIVERTYEATRDCPELNGVRDVGDVLAGYAATGSAGTEHWLIARADFGENPSNGSTWQDVGCVLLAEHEDRQWELLYIGLAPEARGQGWGIELVRRAQWLAAQGGAERLVLAVDANNAPALEVYAAAGFTTWDRRAIFLKRFGIV